MYLTNKLKKASVLTLPLLLMCYLPLSAWALIEATESESETVVEMIDQLEQRHYAKHRYDDELSSLHLDSYIESMDRAKMFFIAADLAEFEKYRTAMDEQLHEGNLEAGYVIFNRFQQRLESRLEEIIETLPDQVANMDFTVDETFPLELDEWEWAETPEYAIRKEKFEGFLDAAKAFGDVAGDLPTLEPKGMHL